MEVFTTCAKPGHLTSLNAQQDSKSYDHVNLILAAEDEAGRGCGMSDVLYERRVQALYASILENAPEAERSVTEKALTARGFDPDFTQYQARAGECSLTGIDEDCCPCGRHE